MKRATLMLAAALTGCSMKPPSGPIAGKAYFGQVGCVTCHRIGAEGGVTGPDLTMVGLRRSDVWLDVWLQNPAAWKPGTMMPNKQLSPAARAAIISYLVTLKGQDWPKGGRPWDGAGDAAARGRLIYLRAGCVGCHGQGGVGGYPNNNVVGLKIPALASVSDTFTKAELIAKIRNGVPMSVKADPKGPDPLISMPRWDGVLDEGEMDAVASYLLTLKSGSTEKSDW